MMKPEKCKCDVCRKNLNNFKNDWVSIKNYWGYFSNQDQKYIECFICEDCWSLVENFIKKLGGKVREYHYCMGTGDILNTWEKALKNAAKARKQYELRKASKIQRSNKAREKK